MGYEEERSLAQEARVRYVALENPVLINQFFKTKGNPDIGRELSIRYFEHAGFTGDPLTTPLIGRDGKQVQHNGQLLVLADYVNFAADHHFEALTVPKGVFESLLMEPGTPDYEDMCASVLARLESNKG